MISLLKNTRNTSTSYSVTAHKSEKNHEKSVLITWISVAAATGRRVIFHVQVVLTHLWWWYL